MIDSTQVILGMGFAALIALIAWQMRSLSPSGGVAAFIMGTIVFGLGGFRWAALLLSFFVSSSLLSKTFKRKKGSAGEKYAKGSQRDWTQVLANGGIGTLCVLWQTFQPESTAPWIAGAAAFAAVNADTWATELGVLSKGLPRLITSGKLVEKGTSGGISGVGTLASLGGAGLVGLVGGALGEAGFWPSLLIITLSGVFGGFVDSLFGATIQAMYYCPTDQKETEQHPHHRCGTSTHHIRGWAWFNNEAVNLTAALAGALAAVGLFFI